MAKTFLLAPDGAVDVLRRRFTSQRGAWLDGGGNWPLRLPLGPPREQDVLAQGERVREWLDAWQRWSRTGEVDWIERRWATAGIQRLPAAIVLRDPEQVAEAIGEHSAWQQAARRHRLISARWPTVRSALRRNLDVLTDWAEDDVSRLVELLNWLLAHPNSGLFSRQLPIPGLDTKWIESRKGVIAKLLTAIRSDDRAAEDQDGDEGNEGKEGRAKAGAFRFAQITGLRSAPVTLRMRLLDPALRMRTGGLGDITAPVPELARLDLPIKRVFIVENLQTGLAFTDLAETAVFMGQGYDVAPYAELPWLRNARCYYWGDLDTHGFAILDRLRQHLPQLRSMLMDGDTLLTHRTLWTEEATQSAATALTALTASELTLYEALQSHRFGARVRLEQERISWGYAWPRIEALSASDR